jgi:hypothetical protein
VKTVRQYSPCRNIFGKKIPINIVSSKVHKEWLNQTMNSTILVETQSKSNNVDKRTSNRWGHAIAINTYLTQRTIVIPNPGILPLQPCGCFWLYIVLWRRCIPRAITGGRISSISRVISWWSTPVIIGVAISIWRLGVLLPHSSACACGWLQHPDELPGK